MNQHRKNEASCTAGTLKLSIAYAADMADPGGGVRRQFRYRVESTDPNTPSVYVDDDVHSGIDAPVDPAAALQTLVSLLSAAGEAYRRELDHPDTAPENLNLFPLWVAEAAYLNADELAILTIERPTAGDPVDQQQARTRYVGVVFEHGDDASETLNILHRQGPKAALRHLAQWDFGSETDDAAEVFERIYDQPPADALDRTYADGDYVMIYNQTHLYVQLVRKDTTTAMKTATQSPSEREIVERHKARRDRLADLSPGGEPSNQPGPGSQASGLRHRPPMDM